MFFTETSRLKFVRVIVHILVVILLTAITQIGGILYIISLYVFRKKKWKKYVYFFGMYLVCTFFIVPYVAPLFGREKVRNSHSVKARSIFYILANRNYVRPKMNIALAGIASAFVEKYPNGQIVYLDANFPFIDKFPLLPHLSHHDGKKLDIALVYELEGKVIASSPSISGYGAFEKPKASEYDQIKKCKARGYWQYDLQKYTTLGIIDQALQFSEKGTKTLVQNIVKQPKIGKVFIEPHLKHRMGLTHPKIRFHGCRAVRHDDHIHIQLK